jgi:hypothetical protein
MRVSDAKSAGHLFERQGGGKRSRMGRGSLTGSEPHALGPALGPLVGLADVALDHLGRLVARVLLNVIAGHVGRRRGRRVARAHGMPRDALNKLVASGLSGP